MVLVKQDINQKMKGKFIFLYIHSDSWEDKYLYSGQISIFFDNFILFTEVLQDEKRERDMREERF